MYIYFLTMLLSSGLAACADFVRSVQNIQAKKKLAPATNVLSVIFYTVALIPLLLQRGFRYGIGTDYFYTYVPEYIKALLGQETVFEPVFDFWVHLFASRTDNYYYFFFFNSVIFLCVVWFAIYIVCKRYFLPVLIFTGGYFYLQSFCFERQYIAMAFCLLALAILIKTKNITICVGLIIFAGCIHTSSLILLTIPIFYFLSSRVKNLHNVLMISIIAIVLLLPLRYVLDYFFHNSRYAVYENTGFVADAEFGWAWVLLNGVIYFVMLFSCLQSRKKLSLKASLLLLIQLEALMFSLMQGTVPLVYRLVWVPTFMQLFSVPYFLDLLPKRTVSDEIIRLGVHLMVVALYLFACFIYWGPADTINIIPYRSIFDVM